MRHGPPRPRSGLRAFLLLALALALPTLPRSSTPMAALAQTQAPSPSTIGVPDPSVSSSEAPSATLGPTEAAGASRPSSSPPAVDAATLQRYRQPCTQEALSDLPDFPDPKLCTPQAKPFAVGVQYDQQTGDSTYMARVLYWGCALWLSPHCSHYHCNSQWSRCSFGAKGCLSDLQFMSWTAVVGC